jgi:RHS repeat-associated protein
MHVTAENAIPVQRSSTSSAAGSQAGTGTGLSIDITNIAADTVVTDYCGSIIYENGDLKYILNPEGYATKLGSYNGDNYVYNYYLKDRLGNNRIVAEINPATPKIIQATDYYPFGMPYPNSGKASERQPYKFGGKEYDEMHGLDWYDFHARNYFAIFPHFLTPDPLCEKYYWISPYAYCANNSIKYIDPNGKEIKLAGTAAERQTTLTHLQRLTNDKLSMRSDGTVIIVRMGGENSGKYLRAGSELIRDLNQKGAGAKTVTISIGTGGNSASAADRNASGGVDWTNATNGTGANATVNFDPTSNPNILTTDPATGNVSGATRPNEIGLGHELVHADHINKGTVDFTPATNTYQTATGTQTQSVATEELRTVGVSGHNNNKATENKIRQEQGLNQRGAY